MGLRVLAVVSALIVTGVNCGPAAACHRGQDCYEKVRAPDVYRTVEKTVVVHPGSRERIRVPAMVETRSERIQVAPPRVLAERIPAVYGSIMRREMVAPATVSYVATPPVIERVHETVVVRPGGQRWEYSRGLRGEERKCKVAIAPVTRIVSHNVVVAPAGRMPVVHPAIYEKVLRPVVLREASVRHTYEPAQEQIVNRTVVVRPAMTQVVEHPPVVATERHQVFVRHGGLAWKPVR